MKEELPFGTRVRKSACPVCKYEMDAATCLSHPESGPKAGDYSICIECAAVLRFGPGMELVEADKVDMAEMEYRQPREFAMLKKGQRLVKEMAAETRGRPHCAPDPRNPL